MRTNDQIGEPGYDQDSRAWLVDNARLLREGRLSAVDAAHVAEELAEASSEDYLPQSFQHGRP